MTGELRVAACEYAAGGCRVFPCWPRAKFPIVAHGFKAATTDVEQIHAWWSQYPNANIGTPTGERFDVVDFDDIGLYDQAHERHGLVGPRVRTGRGAHFYVASTGRRTTKLSEHIDFKAAGGYVLLPPSVHPSGAVYRWIARGEPLAAPNWLRRMLLPVARESRPMPVVPGHVTTRGVASLRAMADRLAHTGEGNRNAFLFWCALRAADTGVGAADVAVVLTDAAQRAGLDGREIARTLDSAFARWTST